MKIYLTASALALITTTAVAQDASGTAWSKSRHRGPNAPFV